MNIYTPNLRGVVDARAEVEIQRALKSIVDYFNDALKNIETKTAEVTTTTVRKQLDLFAASLAAPVIEPTGDELATLATDRTLVVSDIPDLPAAKITSGIFGLGRLPINILKTDDALTEDVTGAPNVNTGKAIIKDNNGHSIKVMTCA